MTSRLGLFLAVAIAASAVACSGGSDSMSPTNPSGARGAQIAGRVSGAGMSSTASLTALSSGPQTQATSSSAPLKVSVNGTNIETNVDGTGHFMLDGVPSGTVVLKFTGRGVDASITLRGVSTGDRIDIDVRLDSGGARLESDHRNRSGNDNDDDDDDDDDNGGVRTLPDGTVKVEGTVVSVSGTCPNLTFGLASSIVKTNSSTVFDDVRCSAIADRSRIEVIGRQQSGAVILATKVDAD